VKSVGRSDVGRQRAANEDSILLVPELGFFAVADGMGGHRGGRVASHMVTTEFARIVREHGAPLEGEVLADALLEINRRVHETGEANEDLHAMGSTCVVASIAGRRLHLAHVGDSRCYFARGKDTRRLTSDHRAIQPMIDQGAITEQESRAHPLRNVLTRSVGVEPHVEVELQVMDVVSGDRLLLCSDGLSDMILEPELLRLLSEASDIEQLADALVQLANDAGGHDNISVLIIEITDED
jgi:protein phosphatase